MMLRPLWENPCEALLPGRSVNMAPCARELIAIGCTLTVVASHEPDDDQFERMNEFKRPRILVTSTGNLPDSAAFPQADHFYLRSTVLGTLQLSKIRGRVGEALEVKTRAHAPQYFCASTQKSF